MDLIQKTLIKAGRKDLAQEYYKKAGIPDESKHVKNLRTQMNMKRVGDVFFENLKIHILTGDYAETLKDRIKDKKNFKELKTLSGIDDQQIGLWIVNMINEHPQLF